MTTSLAVRRSLLLAVCLAVTACPSLDGFVGTDASVDASPDVTSNDSSQCAADTTSDPANCGQCGHDCMGGGCKSSSCQPTALTPDPANGAESYLAVDKGYMYYTYNGQVLRCRRESCTTPEDLSGNAWRLALGPGDVLVWGQGRTFDSDGGVYSDGSIWTSARDGSGKHAVLATGVGNFATIAASATTVYWVERGSSLAPDFAHETIFSCPLTGCTSPTVVIANQLGTSSLALDATSLYWNFVDLAALGQPGGIRKCAVGPTCSDAIVTNLGNPDYLVASGSELFFGSLVDDVYKNEGVVAKVRTDGVGFVRLAHTKYPEGVGVDSTNVYWADLTIGTVSSVPLDGGAATPVATGQGQPEWVVADDKAIYWTTLTGIMKLAK